MLDEGSIAPALGGHFASRPGEVKQLAALRLYSPDLGPVFAFAPPVRLGLRTSDLGPSSAEFDDTV